jgi:hypothetical protein
MTIRELQHQAVDHIKRHALVLALDSPRAQAHILTEYLWSEEGAERAALEAPRPAGTPGWVERMTANQLADELRHAELLRERLRALGAPTDRPPPRLARVKLWWLARATATYASAFRAGPIVVVLAAAAQLEATGVRMFGRHLAVLAQHRPDDPTTAVLRQIVADEQRHARSCANAAERLIAPEEYAQLAELRERVATIDRAFGVTISCAFWLTVAVHAARDALAGGRPAAAPQVHHAAEPQLAAGAPRC